MSRLPELRHHELTAAGQALWDLIVSTRGNRVVTDAGSLSGPFNPMLYAPDSGGPLASLGAALRFGSSLDRRLIEVAILTVASHWQAEFEWSAHARIAREAGVPAEVVDAIGAGEDPPFTAGDERAVYSAARELITTGRLSQPRYEATQRLVGDVGMAEFVELCGYYTLISFLLNAFEVPLPAGVEPMWAGQRDN